MEQIEKIALFRAVRSLSALSKHLLMLLTDLQIEHDNNIERVGESLVEMEEFLKNKYNVDIDLAHLTKHFEFFDEKKYHDIRKKILDYSNQLQRDLQK